MHRRIRKGETPMEKRDASRFRVLCLINYLTKIGAFEREPSQIDKRTY